MRYTSTLRVGLSTAILMAGTSLVAAQEIKIWALNAANDAADAALQAITDEFEAANPGVTVVIEARDVDEHKAALRVAGNSDQGPDIFFSWGGLGLGGEFVKAGLAADMSKYYEEYAWTDVFLPATLSATTQYPGGVFGAPWTFRGEAFYYRKSLFEKAGITELPQTWEELDAAAQKLVDAGIPAITFGGTVNWHVMRLMDAILEAKCGPETHDGLLSLQVDWAAEPCATESFQELHKWTSNYFLKPFMGIDNDQAFALFIGGRAAMMLEGDWLVGQLETAGADVADFGVFQIPTGTGRLYGFGEYFYISSRSPNPDVAAKFLDYVGSDAVQQKYYNIFGATSVNKNVTYEDVNPLTETWLDIFANSSGMYVNGDQAFPLTYTTEYFRVINGVAGDSLDPANAAAELQKFISANPAP